MNIKIDIIILSLAKNDHLKHLTEQTIATLLASEDPAQIKFNIVVLESNKDLAPFQFENTTTIYPKEKFNFNKYLNIGIRSTSNDYICLCNNDLIFHNNWASNILQAQKSQEIQCASTYWKEYHHGERNIAPNSPNLSGGRKIFSGWCFLIRRSLLNKIGLFDERINFWYSDDDFCKVLEMNGIPNILVTTSEVTHVGGYSLKNIDNNQKLKYTILPQLYFEYKWNHHSWLKYITKYIWHSFRIKVL